MYSTSCTVSRIVQTRCAGLLRERTGDNTLSCLWYPFVVIEGLPSAVTDVTFIVERRDTRFERLVFVCTKKFVTLLRTLFQDPYLMSEERRRRSEVLRRQSRILLDSCDQLCRSNASWSAFKHG